MPNYPKIDLQHTCNVIAKRFICSERRKHPEEFKVRIAILVCKNVYYLFSTYQFSQRRFVREHPELSKGISTYSGLQESYNDSGDDGDSEDTRPSKSARTQSDTSITGHSQVSNNKNMAFWNKVGEWNLELIKKYGLDMYLLKWKRYITIFRVVLGILLE